MSVMPIVLESAVAILLAVTLGYCVVLERRMRVFRNDQEALRALVTELDEATERAERAVAGLSQTTRDVHETLDHRIAEARALTRSMAMIARAASKHAPHEDRATAAKTPPRGGADKTASRGGADKTGAEPSSAVRGRAA